MFRLLGFIVGSIASIAALVMLVGMPSFELAGETTENDRFDVVIQQLKDKQQTANETAVPTPSAPVAQETPPTDIDLPIDSIEPAPENPVGDIEGSLDGSVESLFAQAPPDVIEYEATDGDATPDTSPIEGPSFAEPDWQSFWNPFRSEIAANGFVRRLENVTGLDYRVVKIKNGVYEVAFSYNDDDERSSKLTQIAAATGLDLSDTGL
jgi:hypothetical protein